MKLPKKEICWAALETYFHREGTTKFLRSRINRFIFGTEKKCDAAYIIGNRIVWRIERDDTVKKHGRWRTHPRDEVITYRLDGDTLEIFIDGKQESKLFSIKEITEKLNTSEK
jgi:hypothetical protein